MGKLAMQIHDEIAKVADPLLRKSLSCLMDHFHAEWGDRSPLDVFNRLVAKNLGRAGPQKSGHATVREDQITSRKEQWTTARLGALTRGHADPSGVDIACPIVLVEHSGRTIVLNGNHRINRWVRTNDTRVHDVIIHSIPEVLTFVDHNGGAHAV
jgi:hypothetical protein